MSEQPLPAPRAPPTPRPATRATQKAAKHKNSKLLGTNRRIHMDTVSNSSGKVDTIIIREELKETPEVHVAGICYRDNNGKIEILLAKRKKTRKLFPDLLEGCGGQLRYNESFMQGVIRHYRTEMGLTVQVHENIYQLYFINTADNPYIPGIVFLCKYIEGNPQSANHETVEWVQYESVLATPETAFIPGVKAEITSLMRELQTVGGEPH
jgi:8-oxo-dGTP pyrophosphatase MutT (NUDIX family)